MYTFCSERTTGYSHFSGLTPCSNSLNVVAARIISMAQYRNFLQQMRLLFVICLRWCDPHISFSLYSKYWVQAIILGSLVSRYNGNYKYGAEQ